MMLEKSNDTTRAITALPAKDHNLTLLNRKTLSVTGVERILSYDETGAVLQTPLGTLNIGGQGIQVSELSVLTGQVNISGNVEYLQYTETLQSSGGLLARLFR